MVSRTRRIVLFLFSGLLVVFLCAAVAAGAFYFGRRTVTAQADESVVQISEVATVEVPEATNTPQVALEQVTEEEAIAVDDSAAVVAEEPTAAPPAEPTAAPAAAPELEDVERETEFTDEDLALLWEVWQLIEEEYDGQLPDENALTYAAIRGLLGTLDDQFTRFAPPDVAERMREDLQGSFEGIGAFVRENDEGLTEIVRPMAEQPAALAGLEAGDVVISVDGESMIGKSLEEVIALIRGPQGTEVTLGIRRATLDEPFEVQITRQRIEIPIIESEMLEDDIGYVRLTSFNRNADAQLRQALETLLAQNPQGLIFDLRDNPGGYLDQSIAVADLFLPEGVILYDRSMTMGTDQAYRGDNGDLAEEIPLVVLVNAGSASASEIVAGAIQDYDRGVLIGETTFGKGSVQQSHMLSDGSELRVTIARWYTPNNQSIDGSGIAPDIEVETPEEFGGEEDVQLERAIEYLLTGE